MASGVDGGAWPAAGWFGWTDLDSVRRRLEEGADPNVAVPYEGSPLHVAAS